MRHRLPRPAFLAALGACLVLWSCGGAVTDDPAPKLTDLVRSEWAGFKVSTGITQGGLALYMATPKGIYATSADLVGVDVSRAHFRAASNTKTFTAAAIMLLHQQGLLAIDDRITATIPGRTIPYLPDTAQYAIPNKASITIRQLLTHTAGVFDNSNNVVPASCAVPYAGEGYADWVRSQPGQDAHTFAFDELAAVNATCALSAFAPGTDQSYSNTGYVLLGKIIERVSGLAYADYVREKLLTPNALAQTTVPVLGTDQDLPAPYVEGYARISGVTSIATRDNLSANVAEGNVISTPADLARWVRLLVTGNAGVSPASVSAMQACGKPTARRCYGMGLFSIPGLGWGHNGAHRGYVSLMLHNPEDGASVVVFASVTDFDRIASTLTFLESVASKARALLGYSGATGA